MRHRAHIPVSHELLFICKSRMLLYLFGTRFAPGFWAEFGLPI